MEQNKKISARKKGIVASSAGNKTVIVSVDDFKTHKKYGKKFKSTKRYKAHDESNAYKVGDIVEIAPTRPVSKGKKYRIIS